MKNRFPELKRLAQSVNCTVTDDKDWYMIIVEANMRFSVEIGEAHSQITGYGDNVAEWRHEAISDAIERLNWEHPDNVKFLYE